MSSKYCSEVSSIKFKLKVNGVSKLEENNILQNSKLGKFCQQNCMNILAFSENNQSFYSNADFSVRFTTLSERNV